MEYNKIIKMYIEKDWKFTSYFYFKDRRDQWKTIDLPSFPAKRWVWTTDNPTQRKQKWTEVETKTEILKSDMVVFHINDEKIQNFSEQLTCFYTFTENEKPKPSPAQYVYRVTIPAGTKISWYSEDEVRAEITPQFKIEELKINKGLIAENLIER